MRRKKSVKSEWERREIKCSNGGYNQREKESPNKQKQKMKRKNFKKREKWNEKKERQKNIKVKVGNDCNIGGSKAEQNCLVFV